MTHHKAGGALLALLLGLSSVATACGGGGGDEASSGGVDPAPEVSPGDEGSDAPEGSEAPAGDQGDEPSGDGLVTVVIDGTSHELDVDAGMTSQCEVFAGEAMIGAGTGRDPAPTTLAFEFAIGNAATGPSYITITADDGSYEWVAGTNDGRTFEEGTSQVDEVTVEGETATGTATFIDAASEERSPVEGSFDITCP